MRMSGQEMRSEKRRWTGEEKTQSKEKEREERVQGESYKSVFGVGGGSRRIIKWKNRRRNVFMGERKGGKAKRRKTAVQQQLS